MRSFEGCLLSQEDADLLDRFSVYDDGEVKEATNLCAAVDFFADAMKKKLIRKLAEGGFWGWDNVSRVWQRRLEAVLVEHVGKVRLCQSADDPEAEVDIANLVMFHHYLREARREETKGGPRVPRIGDLWRDNTDDTDYSLTAQVQDEWELTPVIQYGPDPCAFYRTTAELWQDFTWVDHEEEADAKE